MSDLSTARLTQRKIISEANREIRRLARDVGESKKQIRRLSSMIRFIENCDYIPDQIKTATSEIGLNELRKLAGEDE